MRNRSSHAAPRAKRPKGVAHLQPRSSGVPQRDSRHARKCTVCRHPERDAIEQDFFRWRSPDQIAQDYGIADHSSVYRHVHATGLFARRRANLRLALEPLIERAATVRVTAASIVSAVRVYAQINDAGEWIGPVYPEIRAVRGSKGCPESRPKCVSDAAQPAPLAGPLVICPEPPERATSPATSDAPSASPHAPCAEKFPGFVRAADPARRADEACLERAAEVQEPSAEIHSSTSLPNRQTVRIEHAPTP